MTERLQKLLSAAGVTSRRGAEKLILEGRVTVNGVPAALGQQADPETDTVLVDGRPVLSGEKRVYLLLNKPRGYVTTLSDEKGRRNAAQLVEDCGARVWPVGRLDMNSEGLLLFTNDGELTNRLLHPGSGVEKEYEVRVRGRLEEALPVLRGPMRLDGDLLAPVTVEVLKREGELSLLKFVLRQGKNRQIRRMCALAGLEVLRLRRVREDTLRLGGLKAGAWRYLTDEEVRRLRGVPAEK